jgi:SAM-dependent methyltransferase
MSLVDAVLSRPSLYLLWQKPFADTKLAPLLRQVKETRGARILDVGCGPGTNTRHFRDSDYLGIDISPEYIAFARKKYDARFEVVDVVNDPIPGAAEFDLIIVNSLLHHIDTPGVRQTLEKLSARLAEDGTVHILDLVQPEHGGPARLLAGWDRGKFLRPLDEWRSLFEAEFDAESLEPYPLPEHGPTLWHMAYFRGRKKRV